MGYCMRWVDGSPFHATIRDPDFEMSLPSSARLHELLAFRIACCTVLYESLPSA